MGHRSKFSGKKLFVTKDKNPRTRGSLGFNSWNFVADNPGVLYEDYIAYHNPRHLRYDLEKGFMKVVTPISNLVFHIKYYGPNGAQNGTAFFISFENIVYLVTARHIVYSMKYGIDETIYIWDGQWNPQQVNMFIWSEGFDQDFAVLEIQSTNRLFKSGGFSISETEYSSGTEVYVYGFPEGYIQYGGVTTKDPDPLMLRGIISGYAINQGRRNIYTDIFTSPGFSGGPLIYQNGDMLNVIGIATECSTGLFKGKEVYTGMGLFTPIKCVTDSIKKQTHTPEPGPDMEELIKICNELPNE